MKKYNLSAIKTITLSCALFVALSTGCKEEMTDTYIAKHSIFFPKKDKANKRIDTVYVSFFNNPGKDELKVPFKINLIGNILDSDTEYSVEVIDSLTTAVAGEYALPEKILFRKGVPTDSLYITIFKKESLLTKSATVTLQIAENENFRVGYSDRQQIKLRFDNIISKPSWWNKEIESVYLGKFSPKKYQLYIETSGKTSTEGLEGWQLREICLKMKKRIEEEKITEEDGSPMEIKSY